MTVVLKRFETQTTGAADCFIYRACSVDRDDQLLDCCCQRRNIIENISRCELAQQTCLHPGQSGCLAKMIGK